MHRNLTLTIIKLTQLVSTENVTRITKYPLAPVRQKPRTANNSQVKPLKSITRCAGNNVQRRRALHNSLNTELPVCFTLGDCPKTDKQYTVHTKNKVAKNTFRLLLHSLFNNSVMRHQAVSQLSIYEYNYVLLCSVIGSSYYIMLYKILHTLHLPMHGPIVMLGLVQYVVLCQEQDTEQG